MWEPNQKWINLARLKLLLIYATLLLNTTTKYGVAQVTFTNKFWLHLSTTIIPIYPTNEFTKGNETRMKQRIVKKKQTNF